MDKLEIVNTVRAINKVSIIDQIIKRKDWVKYLVMPDWHGKMIKNVIVSNLGKEFTEVAAKHVNAYIFDKKEPPAEIAGAIINIADDVLNGREPILRAGDYISLQNYAKGNL
ncbi:MAG: hypothetical protein C3F06_03120 [Candidatus Methanoperedenaceae archaeon]|nr:MAG: hypothetical protein C3F06_03120 [Candidatus Methanoperedenaceae archaeon]